jgi:RimJ/RimL family protein N-acetyltransferase
MKLDEVLDWATDSKGFFHHNLSGGRGFIRLVHYGDCPAPHIEYGVSDGFRYQGIMSKELPKYLEGCAKEGYDVLLAVVMSNNIPSIKLLKKNNFVFIKSLGEKQSYIWRNGVEKKQTEKMIAEVLRGL